MNQLLLGYFENAVSSAFASWMTHSIPVPKAQRLTGSFGFSLSRQTQLSLNASNAENDDDQDDSKNRIRFFTFWLLNDDSGLRNRFRTTWNKNRNRIIMKTTDWAFSVLSINEYFLSRSKTERKASVRVHDEMAVATQPVAVSTQKVPGETPNETDSNLRTRIFNSVSGVVSSVIRFVKNLICCQ